MLDPPLRTSRLTRPQLIALNAEPRVSRGSICELALSSGRWWAPEKPSKGQRGSRHPGVTAKEVDAGREALVEASRISAEQEQLATELAVDIITILDSNYPPALHDLPLPPPVLYVRGSLPDRPCLSIVGSRKASPYGLDVARAFARRLAEQGLAVLSGFAAGVDITAHRAALGAPGGTTFAVLGCGLDIDYPRGRRADRREIRRHGALISEFPFGTTPLPRNFPIRNRLIAALGHGTLVVEATARSGSLITARLALELGRDIYAIPGRIFDDRSAGPNTLVRDGAYLVQHPTDILETLPESLKRQLAIAPVEIRADSPPCPHLSGDQGQVLELLPAGERITIDSLAGRCNLGIDRIAGALLHLELSGWVRRHPGPAYARTELW